MMMKSVYALGAIALIAACAATPADTEMAADGAQSTARDCFNARSVNGFSSVDRDTVRLNVGANRVYEVDVRGAGCIDLDWSFEVGIRTRGSNFICVGDGLFDAELLTDRHDVCHIKAVRRVVEDEDGEASDDDGVDGDDANDDEMSEG